MYLIHGRPAALILALLSASPAVSALDLERSVRVVDTPPHASAEPPEAPLSLLGSSIAALGAPTRAPGSRGGPSLGFALLERMKEHRQGGKGGHLHGTRVIVLIILVCLVVVPLLAVFATPASMQKFMDENFFWFTSASRREATLGTGKGPMPPYGVLKKSGKTTIKKRVSFCEELPSARNSVTLHPGQGQVPQVPQAPGQLLPPPPEPVLQHHAPPMPVQAAPPPIRAAPSAFSSPIASDVDLENRQPGPMRPQVLNDAGYGGEAKGPSMVQRGYPAGQGPQA